MEYQTTADALAAMHRLSQTMAAYNHALGILSHDAATAAPKGTAEGRGRTMAVLSRVTYDLMAAPEVGQMLAVLEADGEALNPQDRREAEVLRKEYDQMHRIPAEEYVAYSVLVNDAQSVWEKAKSANDFQSFAPYLEQIVAYNRKFAGYYNPNLPAYDALLNEYEEGLTTGVLDEFFARLRAVIVPLLEKIRKAPQIDDSFLFRHYPVEKQRLLSDYLMEVLGLDRNYCGIAETEHPYTTNFNNHDVRITTHYYPDALTYSMFSVIHEGGHAIYELGCDDCYNGTALSGGVSMGIHESQSRFFENLVGRSREFITFLFPKLRELFPEQLADVDAEQLYRAVNRVQPSLVRTEADELTYCLHIMVRYEIEKMLIAGSLPVDAVPETWNRLYREYLGIDVPSDKEGCLQDSHWSGGMIGYFPSYALGSAYGPQMKAAMERELGPVAGEIALGDLSRIKGWLHDHIHRYAGFYKPGTLFENACGKFDPRFYADYLTEKYTALYQLV